LNSGPTVYELPGDPRDLAEKRHILVGSNPAITRVASERLRALARRYAVAIRMNEPHRELRGLDLVEGVISLLDARADLVERFEPAPKLPGRTSARVRAKR
jgi:hypothetical protein